MDKRYYYAAVDDLGILCVDEMDTARDQVWTDDSVAELAEDYPGTIYFSVSIPTAQDELMETLKGTNVHANTWQSAARRLAEENKRMSEMLNKLGFCPVDGDSMPCLTCGAGT